MVLKTSMMDHIKKILYYILISFSTILIVLTMLSLIHDLRFWYYKILDFPRFQYLILGTVFIILFLISTRKWNRPSIALLLGLIAVIIIDGIVIFPYFIWTKPVPDYEAAVSKENTFSVLLANVLIDNRESETFLNIIENKHPDLILAMEVDEWWVEELSVLKESYPYTIEYPLDNAYGMSLYSKFPLEKKHIRFFKHDDVPSFHTVITLPSGKSFKFHGIHPVAPIPSKKYPDNVGEQEVALLKVGKLVSKDSLPSIVAGDFNDVAWSDRSKVFGQEGNLKNVRLGRGLYNTFDANSFYMRWPLDHFFVTEEFQMVRLEKLQKIGSDHYPLYARFALEP